MHRGGLEEAPGSTSTFFTRSTGEPTAHGGGQLSRKLAKNGHTEGMTRWNGDGWDGGGRTAGTGKYIQTCSVEIFFQARRSVARLVETLRLPQHFGARAGNEKKPVEVAGYFWSVPAPQHAELDKLQASPTLPAP